MNDQLPISRPGTILVAKMPYDFEGKKLTPELARDLGKAYDDKGQTLSEDEAESILRNHNLPDFP